MFALDWWILLLVTLLANLIWPPVTLAITLYWGVRSTNKTLEKASAIEKKVTDAIAAMNAEAKTEDVIVSLLDAQAADLKVMLTGYKGDLVKTVDGQLQAAEQRIKTSMPQAAGQASTVDRLLTLGMTMMGGGE